jgi:hypothetical protein
MHGTRCVTPLIIARLARRAKKYLTDDITTVVRDVVPAVYTHHLVLLSIDRWAMVY